MKLTKNTLVACVLFCTTGLTQSVYAQDISVKEQRKLQKAQHLYEHLAYIKAIDTYQKIIRDFEDLHGEHTINLANSYRLTNDNANAIIWYKEAINQGIVLTDDDYINYGQVLLKEGQYEEVQALINDSKASRETLYMSLPERLKMKQNAKEFYMDSLLYSLNEIKINSPEADFGPAYYEKGIIFVSGRSSGGILQETYDWDGSLYLNIYQTEGTVDSLNAPSLFAKKVNSPFHEGPSTFFANETHLIFTRNNYTDGKASTSEDGTNKLKLFESIRTEKGWEKPTQLPFNSDEYSVGHPTMNSEGTILYFASDMPGGVGGVDIYKISRNEQGEWGTPENMGDIINTPGDEMFPFIFNDSILYFSSSNHAGLGGLDIYETNLNQPLVVKNMGYPINTTADDFGIIRKGNEGYLASNRYGGTGNDDIYAFRVHPLRITINLKDAITKELIEGELSVSDATAIKDIMQNETNRRSFAAIRGHHFGLTANAKGYTSVSDSLFSESIPKGQTEYSYDLFLERALANDLVIVYNHNEESHIVIFGEMTSISQKNYTYVADSLEKAHINIGSVDKVYSVNYDLDKYKIRDDAAEKLDKVIAILKAHPELMITLKSHTDSRANDAYNDRLSKNRSKSAMKYLSKGGIDKDRILIEGFGESQLLNDCADGQKCDEPTHEQNRRTEIYFSVME